MDGFRRLSGHVLLREIQWKNGRWTDCLVATRQVQRDDGGATNYVIPVAYNPKNQFLMLVGSTEKFLNRSKKLLSFDLGKWEKEMEMLKSSVRAERVDPVEVGWAVSSMLHCVRKEELNAEADLVNKYLLNLLDASKRQYEVRDFMIHALRCVKAKRPNESLELLKSMKASGMYAAKRQAIPYLQVASVELKSLEDFLAHFKLLLPLDDKTLDEDYILCLLRAYATRGRAADGAEDLLHRPRQQVSTKCFSMILLNVDDNEIVTKLDERRSELGLVPDENYFYAIMKSLNGGTHKKVFTQLVSRMFALLPTPSAATLVQTAHAAFRVQQKQTTPMLTRLALIRILDGSREPLKRTDSRMEFLLNEIIQIASNSSDANDFFLMKELCDLIQHHNLAYISEGTMRRLRDTQTRIMLASKNSAVFIPSIRKVPTKDPSGQEADDQQPDEDI